MRLRGDGSGEIVQTIQVSPAFIAKMKASGAKLQDAGESDWRQELEQAAEEVRAHPATFGEGVTFVSAEPIGTDEAPGMRLTLAFADISRVDLSRVQGLGALGASSAQEGSGQDLRFRFDRRGRGRRVLTAVFIEPPAEPGAAAPAPVPKTGLKTGDPGLDAFGKELTKMIEAMFTGMRIVLAVEVPTLIATNSSHVEGNTVTLLEVDMDALLADQTKLAALGGTSDMSLAAMRRLFADVPGVKLPPANEVTIEFRD